MDFAGSVSCSQCGSPVGSSSGRCPFCGAELADSKNASQVSAPSEAAPIGFSRGATRYNETRRASSTARSGSSKQPVFLFGAAAVLVLGGLGATFALRGASSSEGEALPVTLPEPLPKRAKAPGEIVVDDPENVDPSELSPPVQHRARDFNPSARLLSVAASPVRHHGVDLTAPHAQVVYTYYAGKSDPALHPNAQSGRFIVTIEESGALQASFPAGPGDAREVVDEPLCVFSAAIRAGRASGLPEGEPLEALYALDRDVGRAAWKLSVPGKDDAIRYIDGKTCAVVSRLSR